MLFSTPSGSWKESYEVGSVCPFVHPSVWAFPWNCVLSFFSKFWQGARNSYEVVHGRADFSEKIFLPPKLGKWIKNGPKARFF